MTTNLTSNTLQTSWRNQTVWSEVANQLKKQIVLSRTSALLLGILGAILATLAAQLATDRPDLARILSIGSAAALLAVTVVARSFGQKHLENWIRARSISEALKQEVFFYLTRTRPYAEGDPEATLNSRANEIVTKVKDLTVLAATVNPKQNEIPKITSPGDYISQRVSQQIEHYYLPKASALGKRLKMCQWAAAGLTAIAALVSGIAGFFHAEWIGAWVAVATTIAGAIVAHAAAARYEHNVLAYYSTAQQLQSLRDQYLDVVNKGAATPPTFDEFVHRCEEVISIENQAWMADWQKSGNSGQPSNTQPTTQIS